MVGNTPSNRSTRDDIDPYGETSRHKAKPLLVRFIFTLGLSACDIIWHCYVQSIRIFPLSTAARLIRASQTGERMFIVTEQFFMWLCVIFNSYLVWAVLEYRLPDILQNLGSSFEFSSRKWLARISLLIGYLISAILIVLYITLPFWWRRAAWGPWRRSVWNEEVCQGWDYLITMHTVDFTQMFLGKNATAVSTATFWGQGLLKVLYTMTLHHGLSGLSRVSVQTNTSELFTIEYNSTTPSYFTTTNVPVPFIDFPVLSFPQLSLVSRFPEYVREWGCDPPAVVLMNRTQEVVRTTVSNYDDCTMLKVCGRGSIDLLAAPIGAILIDMEKSGICCTSPFLYRLYLKKTNIVENGQMTAI
jgi:hypothetical protein